MSAFARSFCTTLLIVMPLGMDYVLSTLVRRR